MYTIKRWETGVGENKSPPTSSALDATSRLHFSFFCAFIFQAGPFRAVSGVPLCRGRFCMRQNTRTNTEVAYWVWIMAGESAAAVLSKKNGPITVKETAALSHTA